jgi:uncharacterized membrane protein
MLTSPAVLVVYSLAIILGSCLLQVLRKCEWVLIDMGWLPSSPKVPHRIPMALWSSSAVLSHGVGVFLGVSCRSSESSESSDSRSVKSFLSVVSGDSYVILGCCC